ncbi:hypothetical protein PMIN07_009415 [Paraphaeosphaeria minitans]
MTSGLGPSIHTTHTFLDAVRSGRIEYLTALGWLDHSIIASHRGSATCNALESQTLKGGRQQAHVTFEACNMVKFTFKPFRTQKPPADSASEEPQNAYQKRREQVRRAQKTHRERKETYVKSLETEVIQLRANEARLFQETKTLYAEISAMKIALARNGIVIPSSVSLPPQDQDPAMEERWGRNADTVGRDGDEDVFEFSVTEKSTKQSHERIVVRRQPRKRGNGRSLTEVGSDQPFPPFPASFDTSLSSPSSPSPLVGSQDPTAIGMDFILSLEAPCLGHIPHTHTHANDTDTDNASSSSGHALMASATLLHFHDPPTLSLTHPHGPSPAWTVPESGVQRLLELARSIPLDGEVTPVQAWACIRQHPQYASLRVERLEGMKKGLLAWVKCYGFGGVVPQDVFEDTMRDLYT